MKNALEEHLVTKSGREPGGSLLLSLPLLFQGRALWAAQAPAWAMVQPLPRAAAAPAASAGPAPGCKGRHCSPSLLSQELRPPTLAHSHICSTKGRRRLPALANAGHSHEPDEPSVHLQTSSRHNLRFLTYFISTEQLQPGRAGPSPAAEEIL